MRDALTTTQISAADRDRSGAPGHRIGNPGSLVAQVWLSRKTVRLRLTAIYGALFLLAGAILLTVTGLLWSRATEGRVAINSDVPLQIFRLVSPPTQTLPFVGDQPRTLAGDLARAVAARQFQTNVLSPDPAKVRALVGQLRVVARDQHTADLRQFLLYSGIALGAIALLTIALSWLTAGRILRPLRTITARTRDISASNLHERLELAGPSDELHELGETIDQLLERLERSFEAQRQFVANASHELRTPLATMRASLDVALAKPGPVAEPVRALGARLNTELDHIDGLLESFLALARAQRDTDEAGTQVRIDLLVARALERRADAIARREISVREQLAPAAWVEGDETLLTRLVENLVDNAVRHNEPNGYLEARTESADNIVRLVVENGGPILDPDAVAALGKPFRRLGADRTGSEHGFGLGLSIVTAVAETHGGEVGLLARPEGGLRVTVELPASVTVLVGSRG